MNDDMRIGALIRFVLACLWVATLAPWALAQGVRPSIRDELPAEARVDWDAAKELYDDKNYKGALVQFQKVYDQTKNPRVLFNVGVCFKNLQRYSRAVSTWEKELSFKDKLTQGDIAQVEQALQTVRPFVSTLDVTSNEPGAKLYVNGEEVGETPLLTPLPIDVGEQRVKLVKDGFVSVEKTVDVLRATPVEMSLKLVPAAKKTRVTVSIEGAPKANIFIDGVDMGRAPFEGKVTAERHTFEARALGYVPARQTSQVAFGKPFNLKLSLVKSRDEGRVKVVTGHEDATIEIDDKVVGTGAWEGVLPAGGHQLVVKKDGYDTYSSDLALSPNQDRTMRVNLRPEREKAWIYWTVTSIVVVAGGGVASYFVFRPSKTSEVTGTLDPGLVPTAISF